MCLVNIKLHKTLLYFSFFTIYRQLLIYSVRYSNSFAKAAMATKMKQLEEMLNSSSDEHIRTFLLCHFSQRTVSLVSIYFNSNSH